MFTALSLYLLTRRPKTAAVVIACLLPVVLCAGPRKKALREEVERLTLELAECQADSYAPTPCPEVIRAMAEDGDIDRNERKVVKAIMRDHKPVRVAKQARKRVVRVYRNERREEVRTNVWRNLFKSLNIWAIAGIGAGLLYLLVRGGGDVVGILRRLAGK